MAVNNVVVTCDGASGTAGAFIVAVEANGASVDQVDVTGQPVPERGGEPWAWSLSWHIEGEATVELADWTHIDWTSGRGTVRNVHDVYHLSCPVPTTQAPEPTVTVALEPTTTEVVLNTAPLPTTTVLTFKGHDDFYSAESTVPCLQEDDPCWDCTAMGNLICGPTTTLAEPVGCCSDWVGDTTLEVPVATLPATGGNAGPMLGVGAALLAFGLVALLTTRRA